MRMTQLQTRGRSSALQSKGRKLIVSGVLLMSLALSGCSAVNMTGFSFPVFGLNKDTNEQSDAMTTSSMPEGEQRPAAPSGSLIFQ